MLKTRGDMYSSEMAAQNLQYDVGDRKGPGGLAEGNDSGNT